MEKSKPFGNQEARAPSFLALCPACGAVPREEQNAKGESAIAHHYSLPDKAASLKQLSDALKAEQAQRKQAESQLSQMQTELEELSAQLFEQANEMVAAERRERARLEEKIGVLENRDADRRRRVERLEVAAQRIERVRTVVLGRG